MLETLDNILKKMLFCCCINMTPSFYDYNKEYEEYDDKKYNSGSDDDFEPEGWTVVSMKIK